MKKNENGQKNQKLQKKCYKTKVQALKSDKNSLRYLRKKFSARTSKILLPPIMNITVV